MSTYIIRNDRTGRTWGACASEARLYAVGGVIDASYSVFLGAGGGGSSL